VVGKYPFLAMPLKKQVVEELMKAAEKVLS